MMNMTTMTKHFHSATTTNQDPRNHHFGLVQGCIYALGEAHIRSTLSLGSF